MTSVPESIFSCFLFIYVYLYLKVTFYLHTQALQLARGCDACSVSLRSGTHGEVVSPLSSHNRPSPVNELGAVGTAAVGTAAVGGGVHRVLLKPADKHSHGRGFPCSGLPGSARRPHAKAPRLLDPPRGQPFLLPLLALSCAPPAPVKRPLMQPGARAR